MTKQFFIDLQCLSFDIFAKMFYKLKTNGFVSQDKMFAIGFQHRYSIVSNFNVLLFLETIEWYNSTTLVQARTSLC